MLQHQSYVYRYLRYLGASSVEAEDLVQETFLAAFDSRSAPPADETRRTGAWLRAIGRNLFYSYCRRQKRDPVFVSEPVLQAAEAWWAGHVGGDTDYDRYLDALDACLEQVSPRNREILTARHGEGLSRSELADRFGLKEEGVKSVLRRVTGALQQCIEHRAFPGESS